MEDAKYYKQKLLDVENFCKSQLHEENIPKLGRTVNASKVNLLNKILNIIKK